MAPKTLRRSYRWVNGDRMPDEAWSIQESISDQIPEGQRFDVETNPVAEMQFHARNKGSEHPELRITFG
jgi:hypothetical protein